MKKFLATVAIIIACVSAIAAITFFIMKVMEGKKLSFVPIKYEPNSEGSIRDRVHDAWESFEDC